MKENYGSKKVTSVLFFVYLIALAWILLFKLGVKFSYMENRQINLFPFENLIKYGQIDLIETIMNVVIFIPMGIYSGILFKNWNLGKKILFCFLFSFFVEGIQYIFKFGSFDISDIITNTLGGIIGLLIFIVIEKIFKNRAQKLINIISCIATILIIAFLFLLKAGKLWIKYQ